MRPIKLPINGYLGVNLLDNATIIRNEECRLLQNLVHTVGSGLSKRGAIKFNRKVFPNQVVNFSSIYLPTFECNPFVFAVYQDTANDVVAAIAASSTSSVVIPNTYEGRALFVGFDQDVYCFPGRPYTHAAVKFSKDTAAVSGISVAAFDFTGVDNNFTPKVACVYRDRMFYFNLGTDYESTGVFSDDLEAGVVGTSAKDARGFLFGGRDGDIGVAATEIMLSDVGTPAESALLVLRNKSAYILKGEPTQTTDTESYFGDAVISKINIACGCASAQTLVTTPYGVIWAGEDDVWLLRTGQIPIPIGAKIRSRLLESPPAQRYLWSAVYKDGIYRLSILSPGQGPTSNTDPCGEQWWLDLRDGPPQNFRQARWFGPQIYNVLSLTGTTSALGTHMQVVDTRPGRTNDIYSIEGENLCTYDVIDGFDRTQETSNELALLPGSLTRIGNTHTVVYPTDPGLAVGDAILLDDPNLTNIESEFNAGAATVLTIPVSGTFTFSIVAPNLLTKASLCTHLIRKAHTLNIGEQNGNEIVTELHSKIVDLENPMVDKTLAGVELNVQVSLPTQHEAVVLTDRGRQTTTMTDNSSPTDIESDVDGTEATFSDEFVAMGLFPTPTSRPNGKSHQLQLGENPGYVVDESMQYFNYYHGELKTATLTVGYYANLKTFMDELTRAMTAADSITYTHNQITTLPRQQLVTVKHATDTFTFLFKDDSTIVGNQGLTAAQILSNCRIGALAGFNTSSDLTTEGNVTEGKRISASETVPYTRCPTLEYGGINLKLSPQKRNPL